MEYAQQGSGEKKLLLLHGYGDSWYSFSGVFAALAADIHAIAPTLRGHGGSDKPATGYAMQDFARDAVALMDHLGIVRAPIVGHSMGSFVAREMALAYPERVSHLILIDSATTADNAVLRAFHAETKKLTDPIPHDLIYGFQAGICVNPLGEGMTIDGIVRESMKVPAHVWSGALGALIEYEPTRGLDSISCPTLILWGDRDELFPESEQQALHREIPDSELKIYPNTGHSPNWEWPKETAADILSFLNWGSAPV
jgi:pimeloyl-ACP methyl ester carboxylesterase